MAQMLVESPSLINSLSLKRNPPPVVALHSPNPSAMVSLLISKSDDNLLRRIPNISSEEKHDLWHFFIRNAFADKSSRHIACKILESPIGRDLFETSPLDEVAESRFSIVKLFPGVKCVEFIRSAATFIHIAMKIELVSLLEVMERVRPDIVRPTVFIGLHDSKSLSNFPAAITAIGERFKHHCLWFQ